MRDKAQIVHDLRHLKVQTGSLACFGCGHEHNCSVRGCAIIREAADRMENDEAHIAALRAEVERLNRENFWLSDHQGGGRT